VPSTNAAAGIQSAGCHSRPTQHEKVRETGMTCTDCHDNLVHDEIEPRQSFLDSTGGTN
jgi:nitrate/TMAO reductase-like tetraheme cytochrome c subunit